MNNSVVCKASGEMASAFGKVANITKRERYNWQELGEEGTFKWLDKNEIGIDTTYQREEVSRKKTLDIAKDFDWKLFGAVAVVRRPDGTLWAYDGGHRLRASQLRDDVQKIPCMIFSAADISEEAEIFVRSNTNVSNVSAYDLYKPDLARGLHDAIEAKRILAKHGYRATKSDERYGFQAIKTLRAMIKKDPICAEKVFDLGAEIADDGEQVSAFFLRGLFYLAKNVEEDIFSGKWRSKLMLYSMQSINHAIRQEKHLIGKGGERIEAKAILDLLNKKVRNKINFCFDR